MRAVRLAAVAVAAAGLLAGACSSNTSSPEQPGTSTSVAPAGPTGNGAYAQCLADNGVPAPPGPVTGPPPGVDQATWDKATQTCASLAPGPG